MRSLFLLESITPYAFQRLVRLTLARITIPGPSGLQVFLEPFKNQFSQLTILSSSRNFLLELLDRPPLFDSAEMHVYQMRWPLREVIQDMRRIDNRARPTLRLPLKEREKVTPGQQIQIHGDFIKQKHLPGPEQAHGQLHATALSIRDGMHAPVQVNVQDLDQFVPAFGVGVAPDGGEERRDIHVCSDDVVEDPFRTEICHAFQTIFEGISAGYGYCV